MPTMWIQQYNFSSEDLGEVDLPTARQGFETFPWGPQVAGYSAEPEPDDVCPPGMGILYPDGRILHIFSIEADQYTIFLTAPRRPILGFIPNPFGKQFQCWELSAEQILRAIDVYFSAEPAELVERMIDAGIQLK